MLRTVFFIVLLLRLYRSFENEQVYRIVEEQPAKYLIGNFHSLSSSSIRLQYQYNIIALNLEILTIFEINKIDGDLRTKTKIDRDSLCSEKKICCQQKQSADCEIKFKVVMNNDKSELNSRYFRVRVIVEDINDNVPRFPSTTQRIEISEMATIGTILNLPLASDDDIGKNSVQTYTLESDSSAFRLVMTTITDVIYPRLEIIDQIDRETIGKYVINLCALDGGRPINKGCIRIDLIVIDSNDNPPIINQRGLSFRIPKNQIPLEKIGTIRATDRDEGNNALLRYSISELAPVSIRNRISIDAANGDIRLTQKISHDSSSVITFPIVVTDSGSQSLSATATVTINLEDANDESPVITVSDLKGKMPPRPQIAENKLSGQIAAFVHVVDSDQGLNGQVDCNLIDSPYFRLVAESGQRDSNEKEYRIESTQSLDRETKSSFELVLVCRDKGSPSRTSSQTVSITVMDENDNSPVFHPSPVMITVMENIAINALIVHLNITDADYHPSGRSNHVTCTMDSDDNEYVTIDQNTCSLHTRKNIDREVVEKITCQVVAVDRGSPPRQTTSQVVIRVLDENDNKPEFNRRLLEYRVKENQDPTIVAKIVAQDPDEGKNGEVNYQLSFHDNAAHMAFGIDIISGNLYTKVRLDREKRSSYEFEVIAMDNGRIRLASSATVKVIIEDINDNQPKFIYPSKENRSHSYSLYNLKGTPLIKITAADIDEGLNRDIIYEIVSGNNNGVFQLDPSSGQLYLARDLQLTDAGTYTIKIEARDSGEPPLKDVGFLRITFDSRSKIIPSYDRNRGLIHKFRSENDEQGSLLLGRNIILVICVIFVALLAILVFLVMLYFMKKKQILGSDVAGENEDDMAKKCDPLVLASLAQDNINITNNNLWNHGYNTLQLNSLCKQDDQYLPLSPTNSVNTKDLPNNYQRLIRRNENVMLQMCPGSHDQEYKELSNDCSLLYTNTHCRTGDTLNSVLLVSSPGSMPTKNRNPSTFTDSNRQVSSSNDMALNDHSISSSFV